MKVEFPLPLGSLGVPRGWLHVLNRDEAAAAVADSAGLVASFVASGSIVCHRVETLEANESANEAEWLALAAAEIRQPSMPSASGGGLLSATDLTLLRVVTTYREHLTRWPEHKWWGGVDGLEDELAALGVNHLNQRADRCSWTLLSPARDPVRVNPGLHKGHNRQHLEEHGPPLVLLQGVRLQIHDEQLEGEVGADHRQEAVGGSRVAHSVKRLDHDQVGHAVRY